MLALPLAPDRAAGNLDSAAITCRLTTSPDLPNSRRCDALDDLAESDPRLRLVIEMRYFGGFNDHVIAEALGVTDRTVRRDWERAKLMLSVPLKK